jgi:hypothetical protein
MCQNQKGVAVQPPFFSFHGKGGSNRPRPPHRIPAHFGRAMFDTHIFDLRILERLALQKEIQIAAA